jgi:hypothetical protein
VNFDRLLSDGQALVADFGVAHALEQGTDGQLTETDAWSVSDCPGLEKSHF